MDLDTHKQYLHVHFQTGFSLSVAGRGVQCEKAQIAFSGLWPALDIDPWTSSIVTSVSLLETGIITIYFSCQLVSSWNHFWDLPWPSSSQASCSSLRQVSHWRQVLIFHYTHLQTLVVSFWACMSCCYPLHLNPTLINVSDAFSKIMAKSIPWVFSPKSDFFAGCVVIFGCSLLFL